MTSGMDSQLLEKMAALQQEVHRLERDNVALRRRLAKLVPRVGDVGSGAAPARKAR